MFTTWRADPLPKPPALMALRHQRNSYNEIIYISATTLCYTRYDALKMLRASAA